MKTDHGLPTAVVEHEAVNSATDGEVTARPLVLLDHLGRIRGNSNKIIGLPPSSLHRHAGQHLLIFRGSPPDAEGLSASLLTGALEE